jgi:phospholipase/carboxylesterase
VSEPILVQAPAKASQLFLLFHGVGASASGLVPLGQRLAEEFPQAAVVSVPSPFESDLGAGRQWFSVRGVNEENRAERVAEAMPLFEQTVEEWQRRFEVDAAATTLVGFSQGAIMSLEAARMGKALAGRVVSIAGRFAHLPEAAPHCAVHFIHGQDDAVIPSRFAVDAAERLEALGARVTSDVLSFAGHQITPAMVNAMIQRLRAPEPNQPASAAP